MSLVELEVASGTSITTIKADYLLLKNLSDGRFGPEKSVNEATQNLIEQYSSENFTRVGNVEVLYPSKVYSRIAARGVVLVGAGDSYELNYNTLSQICFKAIETLALSSARVESLATVSHGVGFGLDRKTVLQTQLFAFKHALELWSGDINLRRIIYNEIDFAELIHQYLQDLANDNESPIILQNGKYYLKVGQASPLADRLSESITRGFYAFVAMPFNDQFANVYDFGILHPLQEQGVLPIRIDKHNFSGSIINEIKNRIIDCRFFIADVTNANPNVMFELGFAEGRDKQNIIICQKAQELPFDIRDMRTIFYDPLQLSELQKQLSSLIASLL